MVLGSEFFSLDLVHIARRSDAAFAETLSVASRRPFQPATASASVTSAPTPISPISANVPSATVPPNRRRHIFSVAMSANKLEEGQVPAEKSEEGHVSGTKEHLEKDSEKRDLSDAPELRNADGGSINSGVDILALQDLDPALNMKMHLVNNVRSSSSSQVLTSLTQKQAIDEIGWTPYHTKLFFLNGFG